MTNENPKNRQRKPWVQLLAILIGIGPVYIPTIIFHLRSEEPISIKGALFYMTVLGSVMIVVMLLLLKYLCGERIRDLNLKPGNWRKDILVGIGLMVLSLGTFMLLRGPIYGAFPSAPGGGLREFFDELLRSPMLFALIIGPGLIIGAGVFEELTRVFLLTRLWNINPSREWRWLGIAVSVVLFGLIHVYQGPAGMILAGISGLIYAVYYYHSGRVVPLMLAHYLHDAVQFAAVYIMANSS